MSSSSAAADGLPVPVDGSEMVGVVAPDGSGPRYTAVSSRSDTTVLMTAADGGEVLDARAIDGDYGVPLVATDGTPSGLSADGETLVLINPRQTFPRNSTSFMVLDAGPRGLSSPERLTLEGDFSFDALSPDGDTLYLIEYTSRRDFNDYVVREYDLREDRLLPKPVLVPDEEPGEMRGLPVTRTTSADGRWEYTLYDGGGDGEPFIHGLDTVRSASVCIDLPQLEGKGLGSIDLVLDPGGSVLNVTGGKSSLAIVDTETFEVSDPPPPAEPGADGGGSGWALPALLGLGALVLVAAAGWRLRGRRGEAHALPDDPFDGGPASQAEREQELNRTG